MLQSMERYLMPVVARLRRRHADPEAGFGMIELMVAVGVILVAMLAVAYTATVGFTDIAFARQRQGATGIANQTMERVRALPFDTMANGLSNADLATMTDPNITRTGAGSTLMYVFQGEEIARGDLSSVPPLVPHVNTATVGPTSYTIKTYVTYYTDRTTSIFRVTTLVSWVGGERSALSHQIEVQTLFYSPSSGCLSQHTHPFAAPCQAFLYATASGDAGHVDVTGTISGVLFDGASLSLPGYDSGLQAEQIAAIQGIAQTAGATLSLTGQAQQIAGMQSISSGADSDPAQIKPNYLSTVSSSQSAKTLSSGGGGSNAISVTSSGSDAARTTSTTTSSTLNSETCPRITGVTNLNTASPCGGSTATQGTDLTTSLSLAPSAIGPASLAVVSGPACGSTTCVNSAVTSEYLTVPGSGQCPAVSGDGCSHAEASRNLGQMTFGALPAGIVPTGVNGFKWALPGAGYLVRLAGYSDKVSAEAGVGSAAPVVTSPVSGTGSISFWNGNGYTTCTLYAVNCGAGGALIPIPAVTATDGASVTITMTTALTTGGTATDNGGCALTCTRAQASARSASPLIGDITYTVTKGATTLATLTIHVDMGTLIATTSYQKAPVSG